MQYISIILTAISALLLMDFNKYIKRDEIKVYKENGELDHIVYVERRTRLGNIIIFVFFASIVTSLMVQWQENSADKERDIFALRADRNSYPLFPFKIQIAAEIDIHQLN